MNIQQQTNLPLNALSSTEFKVLNAEATIIFVPESNKNDLIKLNNGGQIRSARRVKPFDPTSIRLTDFVGRFYSEELSTEYSFVIEGEKLVLKHSRLSDVELTPTKKDVFNSSLGQTEFIRDANNVIIGCKVSTGRVRNLWFKKMN